MPGIDRLFRATAFLNGWFRLMITHDEEQMETSAWNHIIPRVFGGLHESTP